MAILLALLVLTLGLMSTLRRTDEFLWEFLLVFMNMLYLSLILCDCMSLSLGDEPVLLELRLGMLRQWSILEPDFMKWLVADSFWEAALKS